LAQSSPENVLVFPPTTIALGGDGPALIDGRIDLSGFTLHLSGSATADRLHALAAALPQFADGFPEQPSTVKSPGSAPVRLDLTATRVWGGTQTWQDATQKPTLQARPRKRRR
jgi:AsmA protein